jgi:hypothetical protein
MLAMKEYEALAQLRVQDALADGLKAQAAHRLLAADGAAPARRSILSALASLLRWVLALFTLRRHSRRPAEPAA